MKVGTKVYSSYDMTNVVKRNKKLSKADKQSQWASVSGDDSQLRNQNKTFKN